MATYSSFLAWETSWTEKSGGLQSLGLQKSQAWLNNSNKRRILHFIWQTFWGCQAWEHGLASQLTLRDCSEKSKEGSGISKSLCNKDQVVWPSKTYGSLKKIRHLKLMNLVFFCVWEDAGIWAYWQHSFDVHLSS